MCVGGAVGRQERTITRAGGEDSVVTFGPGFKILDGSGDGKGKAAGGEGSACVLNSVVDTIVDAQGGKVDGKAIEIFGEVMVGEKVEAE